jgi:hypothetical protein
VLRRCLELSTSSVPKRAPSGTRLAHGSAYWCLTRDAVEYILNFVHTEKGHEYRKYYRRTFASDEQFFHTIVANSVYAQTATGRHLDSRRGTYLSANLHLIHPSLSKWYELKDLTDIQESRAFFIRKVSSVRSSGLLDALDGVDVKGGEE